MTIKGRTMSVRGMNGAGVLALIAGGVLGLTAPAALAAPQGEHVVRGNATFDRNGAVTTIHAADGTIINFANFDIAAHETVRFVQPGAQSRVLNRVNSTLPTQINGGLFANGKVFIVNPAGVMFGADSVVNVGQLFAAAGDISNADFASGIHRFTDVQGGITAQGYISADAVHLVGRTVANHGTIVSPNGLVTMTVGDEVLLREQGGRISVVINDAAGGSGQTIPTADAPAIENTGVVNAGRGRVSLAAGDAVSIAVRNAGRIAASGGEVAVSARSGRVEQAGSVEVGSGSASFDGPVVINRGSIDASGEGGSVRVNAIDSALIDRGSTVAAGRDGSISIDTARGDTALAQGSTVSVGDGGAISLDAAGTVSAQGQIVGFSGSSLTIDPTNIFIWVNGRDNGAVFDEDGSRVTGNFFLSIDAVENFAGDVNLHASNDIGIYDTLIKSNGSLTLLAGNDIVLGRDDKASVDVMDVIATSLAFTAGNNIVDNVTFGADLAASAGYIALEATGGAIGVRGTIGVNNGRTVSLRQADTRTITLGGATPLLANPAGTNLVVAVTAGDLVFTGANPPVGSLTASSSRDVVFESGVIATGGLNATAGRDIVLGETGGATAGLLLNGSSVNLFAAGNVVDAVQNGAQLGADGGDIFVTAQTGSADFATADLDNNRTLFLTQALGRTVVTSGPGGLFTNPAGSNLVVRVTAGDLNLGGSAGSAMSARSIDAGARNITVSRATNTSGGTDLNASNDININARTSGGSFVDANAGRNITVSDDVLASGRVTLHAARSGNGELAFANGAAISADLVELLATASSGIGDGRIDLRSGGPVIGGAGDAPRALVIIQDAPIAAGDMPAPSQMPAGLDGTVVTIESRSGGVAIDDGNPFAGSSLDITSAGGSSTDLSGRFDLRALTVNGNASLADVLIVTEQGQTYAGSVLLLGDARLEGPLVVIEGGVNADAPGQRTLLVLGDAELGGNIGSGNALASLLVEGDARLGGSSVRTTGDQSYEGLTLAGGDAQLWSLEDGSILFGSGGVGHTGAARTVDLQVVTTEQGVIMFGGDIGSGNAFADVRLSTSGDPLAGRADIPAVATIGFENGGTINAQRFIVNQHEKVTSAGNLSILATESAQVGDLTVLGDLLIDAPEVLVLRRLGAELLRSDGTVVTDRGVDIAASGSVTITGAVREAGNPDGRSPIIGAGAGVSGGSPARSVNIADDLVTADSIRLASDPATLLDVRINVQPALAIENGLIDQIPDTPRFEDSVTLTVQDVRGLARLGLSARATNPGEAVAGSGGRLIVSDLPAETGDYAAAGVLAAARFDVGAVRGLVQRHESVFGTPANDRTAQIAASIAALVQAYLDDTGASDVSGEAFAGWIAERSNSQDARTFAALGSLLEGLRGLGLTEREYRIVRTGFTAPLAQNAPIDPAELAVALESVRPPADAS